MRRSETQTQRMLGLRIIGRCFRDWEGQNNGFLPCARRGDLRARDGRWKIVSRFESESEASAVRVRARGGETSACRMASGVGDVASGERERAWT